jgi:hypothetical protein
MASRVAGFGILTVIADLMNYHFGCAEVRNAAKGGTLRRQKNRLP